MKITVEFDSKEEFDEYMGGNAEGQEAGETKPRRTRRTKAEIAASGTSVPEPAPVPASAPAAPEMPAPQQMTPQMFGQQAQAGEPSPFGAAGASLPPGPSPAVQALLQRVSNGLETRLADKKADSSTAYDPNAILTWFRQQCGLGAVQATFDQINQSFLPRMHESRLEDIAKMIGA